MLFFALSVSIAAGMERRVCKDKYIQGRDKKCFHNAKITNVGFNVLRYNLSSWTMSISRDKRVIFSHKVQVLLLTVLRASFVFYQGNKWGCFVRSDAINDVFELIDFSINTGIQVSNRKKRTQGLWKLLRVRLYMKFYIIKRKKTLTLFQNILQLFCMYTYTYDVSSLP